MGTYSLRFWNNESVSFRILHSVFTDQDRNQYLIHRFANMLLKNFGGLQSSNDHQYIAPRLPRLPIKRMIPYWSSHRLVCLTFCLPFRYVQETVTTLRVMLTSTMTKTLQILRTRYLEFHNTRSSSPDFQTSLFFWPQFTDSHILGVLDIGTSWQLHASSARSKVVSGTLFLWG